MTTLDEAWAEAEALLPEGWWMSSLTLEGRPVELMNGARSRYSWWEAEARGPKDIDQRGQGETPVLALQALAQRLRDEREVVE